MQIRMKKLQSELLLLLTSAIWGFAFVAQREGNAHLDPLLFNGIRFGLGALVLAGLAPGQWKHRQERVFPWLPGLVLFVAASLQQIGLVWTTAGNAGFITGLYLIFVPILGLFRKQALQRWHGLALIISLTGLYLISATAGFKVNPGDLIVLAGAVFWAWHVQLIDIYTRRMDTLRLACGQAMVCAFLSLLAGTFRLLLVNPSYVSPSILFPHISMTLIPILYSGLLSVGVAYTLQVHAQKKAPPLPAALIMCLESVFALLGGWWLLKEVISLRMLIGVGLLLGAMLLVITTGRGKSGSLNPSS